MKYFLTTDLPRLASWGSGFSAGLARAEEDYFSANERCGRFARREPSEAGFDAHNRRRAEAEARALVHILQMGDPAAFADLDRELPLRAFLRRQWAPPEPREFLAFLDEAVPIARTLNPEQIPMAEDASVLDIKRRPGEPIPVAHGSSEELTAIQASTFARLVREEAIVERQLIDEISLWYLEEAEYLAQELFGRRPGETDYLPGDPSEEDFRRLALIREIHFAPSTCRLAVVFQVTFLVDFEHGTLCTALLDEFESIHLGDVSALVWLV